MASRAPTRSALLLLVVSSAACDHEGQETGPAPDGAAAAFDGPPPWPDGGLASDALTVLLGDGGIPVGTSCLAAAADERTLDLTLVEVSGRVMVEGLAQTPDCSKGHLLSPASTPARVLLLGAAGNFVAPVDCAGNFRTVALAGRYNLIAALSWDGPAVGATSNWVSTLASDVDLRESRRFAEPFVVRFFPLTGTVTFNGRADLFAAANAVAPGAPCFVMTLDEQRSDGTGGNHLTFTADCAGHFSLPVPAGKYGLDLRGPAAGRQADVKLAAGDWRLTPTPLDVRGPTSFSADVPLVSVAGLVQAAFALPCAPAVSQLDLRHAQLGTIFALPLCQGRFAGFLSPGTYGPSLLTETGGGTLRARVAAPLTVEADATDVRLAVATHAIDGALEVDGAAAIHLGDGVSARVVFLGESGNSFSVRIPPGSPIRFATHLAPDVYDLVINAQRTLPGGRFAKVNFLDLTQGPPAAALSITTTTIDIAGELTFSGQPAGGDRCAGYDVSLQSDNGFGVIAVPTQCQEGRLRFSTKAYPAQYRVAVQRPNARVEFLTPFTPFPESRTDLVMDLEALEEVQVTGRLRFNGCVLREPPGSCATRYAVTLRNPAGAVAYPLAAVALDQPFLGRVLPGTYTVYVRFILPDAPPGASPCASSPVGSAFSEVKLLDSLTVVAAPAP